MNDKNSQITGPDLLKMVDMRIPLPWLLSGIGAVVMVLVGMWFTMGQLAKDVAEMQSTMKAQATAASTIDRENYRMSLRMDAVEQKIRELQRLPSAEPTK